jgi:pimeloyl-ACP methyl ester carboxylesterase
MKMRLIRCSLWLPLLVLFGVPGVVASEPPQDYTRTPVLFVHGYYSYPGVWRELMEYLARNGYPREYLHAVTITPNTMGNAQAASNAIAPAVLSLLSWSQAAARKAGFQRQAPQKVDIVSHSMGSVSSRWYAVKLHPERVRRFISLAGANHGSDVLCRNRDSAARDLCPAFASDARRNPVQLALNGTAGAPVDETPYGVAADRQGIPRIPPDGARRIAYFTVRVEPDEWIKPERSTILDGAGGLSLTLPLDIPLQETSPGNFVFYGEFPSRGQADHDSLIDHPALHRLAAILLAARDP